MNPTDTFRRRFGLLAAMAAAVASLASLGSGAQGDPAGTTLERTILDLNGDGRFEYAAGEDLLVREDLAKAQAGRESRRAALASFVGFADFQLADEESPIRGPWIDLCGSHPFISAFRPQESMVPHLINSNIRAANAIAAGPVTGRPFDFGIQLGDAADNTQRNETRWFIDLLDGSAVNNAGTKLLDPDSGNHALYEGPQGGDPWSSPSGDRSILELANDPFFAPGLRRANGQPVPWYSVLGNHDAKIQGTLPNLPGWWELAHTLAQGPLYVRTIGPDYIQELCADPAKATDPAFWTKVLARPATTGLVTADGSRATLTRNQWAAEHLPPAEAKAIDPGARGSKGLPAGHGFLDPRCTDAAGKPLARLCYSYDSAGIHYIVLDTNPDEGFEGGNIDTQQLAWLERELVAHSARYYDASGALTTNASAQNSLVVVFSHHTKDSMDESFPINLKTTDFPTLERLDDDGRAFGEEMSELMLRFPNVVLHAAGHTHENRVWARPGRAAAGGQPGTGYWEVNSSSHADWPSQSRTLEIVDNKDGTLSVFGVIFDATAPPQACGGVDDSETCLPWSNDATDESAIEPGAPKINEEYLAAVAREVGYNDPQAGHAADADARGRENSLVAGPSQDRNVELLIANPMATVASGAKFTRAVAGTKLIPPAAGSVNPGAPPGVLPDIPSADGPQSTSSSFTRTFGTAQGREVDEPATHSALPDWAIASASLLFFATAALFWIARARVRDWMLGVPARRPPLG